MVANIEVVGDEVAESVQVSVDEAASAKVHSMLRTRMMMVLVLECTLKLWAMLLDCSYVG